MSTSAQRLRRLLLKLNQIFDSFAKPISDIAVFFPLLPSRIRKIMHDGDRTKTRVNVPASNIVGVHPPRERNEYT